MSSTPEHPLQYDMFTGVLVDARTDQQKKRDRERVQPKQMELFAAREVAQFGVNPRPLISLSEHTKLTLWKEDPRTQEEIEADRQRAAQEANYKLLEGTAEEYAAVLRTLGEEAETGEGRGELVVPEPSSSINPQTPASLSEVGGEAHNQTVVTADSQEQPEPAEPDRLNTRFFDLTPFYTILSQAALAEGTDGWENLSPESLAALNEQLVEHIAREVSREGFWEVEWAQEALEEWIWNFLDMYCLIDGDPEEYRATVWAIMDTARSLWETAQRQEQADRVGQGDIESMAADDTTLALVVYGFWEFAGSNPNSDL